MGTSVAFCSHPQAALNPGTQPSQFPTATGMEPADFHHGICKSCLGQSLLTCRMNSLGYGGLLSVHGCHHSHWVV